MDVLLYILIFISITLSAVTIYLLAKGKKTTLSKEDREEISGNLNNQLNLTNQNMSLQLKIFQDNLSKNQKDLEERVEKMSKNVEDRLEKIRESNEKSMEKLQSENTKQLDKMRETVDEKLSKTINDRFDQSFKVLAEQLERVTKSIGEMQTIATDVGSLTKMLSNVKTTGIFGEIQLGAILEQMLSREQYETNIVTGQANEPVEFAIKFPGEEDGEFVYLPIDSKFPYTVYGDLQTAYEQNDFDAVKQKKEQLKNTIKGMAKDICTKYIDPPKTTDFAVMFLPIEGLYAEVAKMGMIEELQAKYKVTIAGPTTMGAMLNSFRMGFRTLAIQKKSGEITKLLSAVRTEFDKFDGYMVKIKKRLNDAGNDLDELIGRRSRAISNKLKNIEKIDAGEACALLEISDKDTSAGEQE